MLIAKKPMELVDAEAMVNQSLSNLSLVISALDLNGSLRSCSAVFFVSKHSGCFFMRSLSLPGQEHQQGQGVQYVFLPCEVTRRQREDARSCVIFANVRRTKKHWTSSPSGGILTFVTL